MYKRFAIMPKRYVDVTEQPRKESPPGMGGIILSVLVDTSPLCVYKHTFNNLNIGV